MRVLTVWHRLLILFLKRKNEIIQTLTGITYVSDVDLEEIKTWPKADVKKVLDNIKDSGDSTSCPWCIKNDWLSGIENSGCPNCTYGKRHSTCDKSTSSYFLIVKILRSKVGKMSFNKSIHSIEDVNNLINDIITVNRILSEIL